MAIKVKLIIKGIALLHPFSDAGKHYWKILFPYENKDISTDPTEKCHDLKFSIINEENNTDTISPIDMIDKYTKIEVFSDHNYNGTINNNLLFNINDSKAHANSGLKKKANTKYIELIIPKIDLKVIVDENKPTYVLFESLNNKFKVNKAPFEIGSGIECEFTSQEIDKFGVKVSNGNATSLDLKVAEGNSYIMTFDHDCNEKGRINNDFQMIYDYIVEDSRNSIKRYELEWVPNYLLGNLMEGELIDKWLFKFLQNTARVLFHAEKKTKFSLDNGSNVKYLVANDITYPCFVIESDGDF